MTSTASPDSNFRQGEHDKFDELAQRWWGEAARSRTTGSRGAERLRMDAQAGAMRHGWIGGIA
jgi:2-polyprenyl-3-methyl-5-hydroxy-6-metoxy-1,4-benzoquinol methylase